MNKVEKHETDETCNVCEKQQVIDQYGSLSCDNHNCPASRFGEDISWNSSDYEIQEYYLNADE